MQRRSFLCTSLLGAAGLALPLARAADWPQRPVRVIVSLPPGSGADTTARFLAQQLSQRLGQSFIVENKPGANSFIAARAVIEAEPDGHTLFVASNTPMVTNAVLFKTLPYDPIADFAPVTAITRLPMFFVVPEQSPYTTLAALVDAMRAAPGKLNFASGTATYEITMQGFHELHGIKGTSVNYKGTGPAIIDLAAGICDYSIAEVSAVLPLIRGGKLRALAVAAAQRHHALPDVPTADEAGSKGFEGYAWTGVYFPAKVPDTVIQRAGDVIRATLRSAEGTAFIENMGGVVFTSSPQQFAAFQRTEIDNARRIVASANIPMQ